MFLMWYTKIHLAMKLQRSNELPQDLMKTTSYSIKTISQVILLSHIHSMIMLLKINNINMLKNKLTFLGRLFILNKEWEDEEFSRY